MHSYSSSLALGLVILALLPIGCDVSNPGDTTRVLLNTSFENNTSPTFDGWTTDSSLDSLISPNQPRLLFVSDAPPGGGRYSLEVISTPWLDHYVGKYIYTSIQLPPGTHEYQLSVSAKLITGSAVAGLSLVDTSGALFLASLIRFSIDSPSWNQYTGKVNLSGSSGILIYVGTVSPLTNLNIPDSRKARFDLIKLEQLN